MTTRPRHQQPLPKTSMSAAAMPATVSERLLFYIWQFQHFNRGELTTTHGEPIEIKHPGFYNTNQGPDFTDARLLIQGTTWAGNVEIHVKASDWSKHGHQQDHNYDNVILHVVWVNDGIDETNQARIPTLELYSRVPGILLERYTTLLHSTSFIPCEKMIGAVGHLTWQSWKERLLAERLLRKAAAVDDLLRQNNFHWEETFWWMLARNFGMKVNADAFESIARSIPVSLLAKHKNQVHQVEALLMGQAGLLEKEFVEHYPSLLKKEYRFLQKKYGLEPIPVPLFSLRMRPSNFPAVRLAQLAMLVVCSSHLFSRIREAHDTPGMQQLFTVTANDYWHYHYQFDRESSFRKKTVGTAMVQNIVINTVAPVLFAYGHHHGDNRCKDKAIRFLEETAPEINLVTKGFSRLQIESKNARDSQALIELKNEYCNRRRCLGCSVGYAILRHDATVSA